MNAFFNFSKDLEQYILGFLSSEDISLLLNIPKLRDCAKTFFFKKNSAEISDLEILILARLEQRKVNKTWIKTNYGCSAPDFNSIPLVKEPRKTTTGFKITYKLSDVLLNISVQKGISITDTIIFRKERDEKRKKRLEVIARNKELQNCWRAQRQRLLEDALENAGVMTYISEDPICQKYIYNGTQLSIRDIVQIKCMEKFLYEYTSFLFCLCVYPPNVAERMALVETPMPYVWPWKRSMRAEYWPVTTVYSTFYR